MMLLEFVSTVLVFSIMFLIVSAIANHYLTKWAYREYNKDIGEIKKLVEKLNKRNKK